MYYWEDEGNVQSIFVATRILSFPFDSGSVSCIVDSHLTERAIRSNLLIISGESRTTNVPSGRNNLSTSTITSTILHLQKIMKKYPMSTLIKGKKSYMKNIQYLFLPVIGSFMSDSTEAIWIKS